MNRGLINMCICPSNANDVCGYFFLIFESYQLNSLDEQK